MQPIDWKRMGIFLFIVAASCGVAYMVDQYYIAGRGYTFFFDILKL